MTEIRIGDTLSLLDGDWLVEGLQGGCLRLRNAYDQQVQVLHVTALPRLLVTPPQIAPDTPGPRTFDTLAAPEAREATELARHVEEVVYGVPRGDAQFRPEYDPEVTGIKLRAQRKAAELTRSGRPVTDRTVLRWVALYREGGPSALVDRRQFRQTPPLGTLDVRVKDALVSIIARATDNSTTTVKKLISDTKAELLHRHPGEEIPIPSDRTMRRHIGVLTKGKYTTGNAANRRSAANVPKRMFSARPAIAPGHEVQVDSSPFDVLALGDDGKPLRAKLTIMLDKATQSIIATSVNVRGTKGVDLAFMLAQCLTPRPARPNAGELANENELRQMPWAAFLTGDELERCDLTRPFIKPQRIMTDNGMDYLSGTFLSACEMFGIDITRSAIRTPTDKPNVERAFHTIKTRFVEHLPGNTGGSVDRRGLKPEDDDLLDIHTLAELFDRWVSVVWQNMRHDALRDPVHPQVVHSPNSMYMAMFDMTGYVPVPLSQDDYIALLPTVERTIQLDGIQVNYRRYDSTHLHPYRLQPSGRAEAKGKWVVHYNPHNPAAVWVRDPETSAWIECPWMNKDAFDRPFSAAIRRKAREITAANGALGDPYSTQATIELIGQTKDAKADKARRDAAAQMERELAERAAKPFPKPATVMAVVAEPDDDDDEYEEFEIFDPRKAN